MSCGWALWPVKPKSKCGQSNVKATWLAVTTFPSLGESAMIGSELNIRQATLQLPLLLWVGQPSDL